MVELEDVKERENGQPGNGDGGMSSDEAYSRFKDSERRANGETPFTKMDSMMSDIESIVNNSTEELYDGYPEFVVSMVKMGRRLGIVDGTYIAKRTVKKVEKEHDRQRKKLNSIDRKLESLRETYDHVEDNVNDAEISMPLLENDIKVLEKELNEYDQKERDTKENYIETGNKEFKDDIESYRMKKNNIRKEIREKESKLKEVQTKYVTRDRKLQKYEVKMEKLEARRASTEELLYQSKELLATAEVDLANDTNPIDVIEMMKDGYSGLETLASQIDIVTKAEQKSWEVFGEKPEMSYGSRGLDDDEGAPYREMNRKRNETLTERVKQVKERRSQGRANYSR